MKTRTSRSNPKPASTPSSRTESTRTRQAHSARRNSPAFTRGTFRLSTFRWIQGDSNSRPSHCERDALPTAPWTQSELQPTISIVSGPNPRVQGGSATRGDVHVHGVKGCVSNWVYLTVMCCWVGLRSRRRGRHVWNRWVPLNQNESYLPVPGCSVAYLLR